MSETRKLVATLVADVVGYGRLAGADEDRTLAGDRRPRVILAGPRAHSVKAPSNKRSNSSGVI
jgi:adenylate cyclase